MPALKTQCIFGNHKGHEKSYTSDIYGLRVIFSPSWLSFNMLRAYPAWTMCFIIFKLNWPLTISTSYSLFSYLSHCCPPIKLRLCDHYLRVCISIIPVPAASLLEEHPWLLGLDCSSQATPQPASDWLWYDPYTISPSFLLLRLPFENLCCCLSRNSSLRNYVHGKLSQV